MNNSISKNIITIILLFILIVACMFAIRNASDTTTIRIKMLNKNDFDKNKKYKEIITNENINKEPAFVIKNIIDEEG